MLACILCTLLAVGRSRPLAGNLPDTCSLSEWRKAAEAQNSRERGYQRALFRCHNIFPLHNRTGGIAFNDNVTDIVGIHLGDSVNDVVVPIGSYQPDGNISTLSDIGKSLRYVPHLQPSNISLEANACDQQQIADEKQSFEARQSTYINNIFACYNIWPFPNSGGLILNENDDVIAIYLGNGNGSSWDGVFVPLCHSSSSSLCESSDIISHCGVADDTWSCDPSFPGNLEQLDLKTWVQIWDQKESVNAHIPELPEGFSLTDTEDVLLYRNDYDFHAYIMSVRKSLDPNDRGASGRFSSNLDFKDSSSGYPHLVGNQNDANDAKSLHNQKFHESNTKDAVAPLAKNQKQETPSDVPRTPNPVEYTLGRLGRYYTFDNPKNDNSNSDDSIKQDVQGPVLDTLKAQSHGIDSISSTNLQSEELSTTPNSESVIEQVKTDRVPESKSIEGNGIANIDDAYPGIADLPHSDDDDDDDDDVDGDEISNLFMNPRIQGLVSKDNPKDEVHGAAQIGVVDELIPSADVSISISENPIVNPENGYEKSEIDQKKDEKIPEAEIANEILLTSSSSVNQSHEMSEENGNTNVLNLHNPLTTLNSGQDISHGLANADDGESSEINKTNPKDSNLPVQTDIPLEEDFLHLKQPGVIGNVQETVGTNTLQKNDDTFSLSNSSNTAISTDKDDVNEPDTGKTLVLQSTNTSAPEVPEDNSTTGSTIEQHLKKDDSLDTLSVGQESNTHGSSIVRQGLDNTIPTTVEELTKASYSDELHQLDFDNNSSVIIVTDIHNDNNSTVQVPISIMSENSSFESPTMQQLLTETVADQIANHNNATHDKTIGDVSEDIDPSMSADTETESDSDSNETSIMQEQLDGPISDFDELVEYQNTDMHRVWEDNNANPLYNTLEDVADEYEILTHMNTPTDLDELSLSSIDYHLNVTTDEMTKEETLETTVNSEVESKAEGLTNEVFIEKFNDVDLITQLALAEDTKNGKSQVPTEHKDNESIVFEKPLKQESEISTEGSAEHNANDIVDHAGIEDLEDTDIEMQMVISADIDSGHTQSSISETQINDSNFVEALRAQSTDEHGLQNFSTHGSEAKSQNMLSPGLNEGAMQLEQTDTPIYYDSNQTLSPSPVSNIDEIVGMQDAQLLTENNGEGLEDAASSYNVIMERPDKDTQHEPEGASTVTPSAIMPHSSLSRKKHRHLVHSTHGGTNRASEHANSHGSLVDEDDSDEYSDTSDYFDSDVVDKYTDEETDDESDKDNVDDIMLSYSFGSGTASSLPTIYEESVKTKQKGVKGDTTASYDSNSDTGGKTSMSGTEDVMEKTINDSNNNDVTTYDSNSDTGGKTSSSGTEVDMENTINDSNNNDATTYDINDSGFLFLGSQPDNIELDPDLQQTEKGVVWIPKSKHSTEESTNEADAVPGSASPFLAVRSFAERLPAGTRSKLGQNISMDAKKDDILSEN